MRASAMCISCILSGQEKMIRDFADEQKKSDYLHQVLGILYEYGMQESSPQLIERINRLYEQYWGKGKDFTQIKHKYNELLLQKEAELEQQILKSEDVLKECIKYVCAANYIDFSAVENVNENTFEELLKKAAQETVCEEEYQRFRSDLKKAKKLAYLIDNCGEIVLDKVFIKCLKQDLPHLQITAVVRGTEVINDATMTDAGEVGLTELVTCIGNGNAAPGTVVCRLNEEAKKVLDEADVIIAKGQGNFESLFGEGYNPYYLFLCKCELFVRRFGLARFESVLAKEERIKDKIS